MQHIALELHEDASTAPIYGVEEWAGATLQKAVIVRKGTEGGNATIDLQFVDASGKQFVAMITANLLAVVMGAAMGPVEGSVQ